MEMVFNNGFCELSENDMIEVEGGGFWSTVADGVSGFVANKIIWTNAKNLYDNFYYPITPSGDSHRIYS